MSACSGGERSDGGSGGWEANDAGGKPGGWGKHAWQRRGWYQKITRFLAHSVYNR